MSEPDEDKAPDDVYDLAPAPAPTPGEAVEPRLAAASSLRSSAPSPANSHRAPQQRNPIPIAKTAAPLATLEYRPKTAAQPDKAEQLKNFYMPLWLLGVGVPVEIVAAFLREKTIAAASLDVGYQLLFGTAFMLAGILIAVKFRGINLGRFWTAVLRLAAISVAPSALVSLLTPMLHLIPFGALIALAVEFVLYFALLGAMFDLDESDTWYCVCVIFLLNLAVYFLLIAISRA